MDFRGKGYWALILGGSSGFGLAAASRLAAAGMNICVVHRDRRGAMARIEEEFNRIRSTGVSFLALNTDALTEEGRAGIFDALAKQLSGSGKIRVLMHSIAFGNLKPAATPAESKSVEQARGRLAERLGVSTDRITESVNALFAEGLAEMGQLADPPAYDTESVLEDEDIASTVFAMGTSLLGYVQEAHRRGLFAPDARVLSMTSEGNTTAWRAYAAVSAAKAALEAISRSVALEFAPFGIRCNVVQAGVTDTPALRLIPGNEHLQARMRLRNPLGRLTRPEDVANVVLLLSADEAAWINGALIRVDGGEHIAG